ncbi:MAG TPA: hypothetical protein VF069_07870 [Streptosporangiaceae bacterium]
MPRHCPICGDFRRDQEASGLCRAYGKEALDAARFYERDGIVLFCPVAPLVPGYLMLAYAEHNDRVMLYRPASAFVRLLADVLAALESRFGAAWCFEHAGAAPNGPSCVPHGHVHALPGAPPVALFESASRIAPMEAREPADVYVRTRAGGVGLLLERRNHQHVRRVIGAVEGIEWDWRLHRHETIYRATTAVLDSVISDLAGAPGGPDSAFPETARC